MVHSYLNLLIHGSYIFIHGSYILIYSWIIFIYFKFIHLLTIGISLPVASPAFPPAARERTFPPRRFRCHCWCGLSPSPVVIEKLINNYY